MKVRDYNSGITNKHKMKRELTFINANMSVCFEKTNQDILELVLDM